MNKLKYLAIVNHGNFFGPHEYKVTQYTYASLRPRNKYE